MSTAEQRQAAVDRTNAEVMKAKKILDELKKLEGPGADKQALERAQQRYDTAVRENNAALAAQSNAGEGYAAHGGTTRRRRRRKTRRVSGQTRRSYRGHRSSAR
jgi:hypothetical protein